MHLPFFVAPSASLATEAKVATRTALPASDTLVLVAEDNEFNQRVIAAKLRHLGFRAEVASNGRAAPTLWRSGRYSIVLTDLRMPERDG